MVKCFTCPSMKICEEKAPYAANSYTIRIYCCKNKQYMDIELTGETLEDDQEFVRMMLNLDPGMIVT